MRNFKLFFGKMAVIFELLTDAKNPLAVSRGDLGKQVLPSHFRVTVFFSFDATSYR
jgi:hypothetical protein